MQNCLIECAAIERPRGAASGVRLLWIGQHIQLSPGQMKTLQAYTDVRHICASLCPPFNHSQALYVKQGSINTSCPTTDRCWQSLKSFPECAGSWHTIHRQAAGAILICALPPPPQAVDAAGYVARCCGLATARHACYPNKMPARPMRLCRS